MKCPRCGAWSQVKETRVGAHHTLKRRRECANGHRFVTVEIHAATYGSVKQRLQTHVETLRARWALWARDREIAQRLHEGWRVLAARYSLTKTAVYLAAKRGRSNT